MAEFLNAHRIFIQKLYFKPQQKGYNKLSRQIFVFCYRYTYIYTIYNRDLIRGFSLARQVMIDCFRSSQRCSAKEKYTSDIRMDREVSPAALLTFFGENATLSHIVYSVCALLFNTKFFLNIQKLGEFTKKATPKSQSPNSKARKIGKQR